MVALRGSGSATRVGTGSAAVMLGGATSVGCVVTGSATVALGEAVGTALGVSGTGTGVLCTPGSRALFKVGAADAAGNVASLCLRLSTEGCSNTTTTLKPIRIAMMQSTKPTLNQEDKPLGSRSRQSRTCP